MVLFGFVMRDWKGLFTRLLRHGTVRIWHGLLGSAAVVGRFSTQDPRWSRSTETSKGRWVPFLPIYSALTKMWLGNSRSIPKLQLCSYGVWFAPGVRSGPLAPKPTSFNNPSEFPAG